MALYTYCYGSLLTPTVGQVDAKTKAQAVKALKAQFAPTCKLKWFLPRLTVTKVKVPKVERFDCAVCGEVLPRTDFVQHVRGQHG